jgi:hypothetical protein
MSFFFYFDESRSKVYERVSENFVMFFVILFLNNLQLSEGKVKVFYYYYYHPLINLN